MDTFPSNTQKGAVPPGAKPQTPPKQIKQVTTARKRKASLSNRFTRTFVGGDAKTALEYVVESVVIPTIRDTIFEAGSTMIERLIYGSARPRRGPAPMAGPLGYVSYNRAAPGANQRPSTAPQLSKQARARHDFGEIVLESRPEAEEVWDQMYNILERYDVVTIADLYDLTGLQSSHTDHKWGWTQLRNSGVSRVRGGGYSLELPEPQPLE